MRDNRKITILIGVSVFIIVLSVVLIFGSRDPVVKELAIDAATETSTVEGFGPENTETIDILTVEVTSEPTEAAQVLVAGVPTARAGLESTNPDKVKLASGDIQLIELFAFW